MIQVVEEYRGWTPSLPAREIVRGLLDATPQQLLGGLSQVQLTNYRAPNRRQRRARWRGRKARVVEPLGLYSWRGQRRTARITLFVDQIERSGRPLPRIVFHNRLLGAYLFGSVLFREIGHHVYQSQQSDDREPEEVADLWRSRLLRAYCLKRHPYTHWWLRPVARWVWDVLAQIARLRARLLRTPWTTSPAGGRGENA